MPSTTVGSRGTLARLFRTEREVAVSISDPEPVEVSVIVPAKDEVDSLEQLVAEIRDAFEGERRAGGERTWEIIIVDDGSTDGSWNAIEKLSLDEPRLTGLRFRRNLGKSFALAAGIEASRGEIIVTLDGDLQFDPAEALPMIDRVSAGADIVSGATGDERSRKGFASRFFNAVTGTVTGLRLRDHNCGFKVGRREVFEDVSLYGEMHRYIAVVAHARGYRVVEQTVTHRPRQHGRSKFGPERYVRGALDLLTVVTLTRFGRRPAHLFGGLGVIVGLVGFGILLYLTGVWFLTDWPIGNRPLLLLGVLLVLLSVQLASVGLLAELIISRDAALESPLRHVVERTGRPGRFAA
jgi:glycosyltransferase involved in cell wall biosynthesis